MSQPASAGFGPEFVVPFDGRALAACRARSRKSWQMTATSCLLSTAAMALVLFGPGAAPRWLAVTGAVVAVLALLLGAMMLVAYAGGRGWTGVPDEVAMRFDHDTLWLAGDIVYPWAQVAGLSVRTSMRQRLLHVDLVPGAKPDRPVVVGADAGPFSRLNRLFGLRGPRLHPSTLAVPVEAIDAAVRFYSAGRVGVRA
jgi:hypothetical protein